MKGEGEAAPDRPAPKVAAPPADVKPDLVTSGTIIKREYQK